MQMIDEEVAQMEKTKSFIVQQQEMKLLMHQGTMAGQPARAVATKGVDGDGAAEWTISFEDGSLERYPEVDTADCPQSFPNLFSNLGEAGFWAAIDPSDNEMVQAIRNHVLGEEAQIVNEANQGNVVSSSYLCAFYASL